MAIQPDGGTESSRIIGSTGYGIVGAILRFNSYLAQALVVFMTASITVEVVGRYVFKRPLGWTIEVSEWILLAMTFLGAAIVLRNNGHVRVDIVVRMVPAPVRRVMDVLSATIGFAVCAMATYFTAKTAYGEYVQNVLTISVLKFPRFWLLSFFPLGFFFLTVEWVFELLIRVESMLTGRDPVRFDIGTETGT